MRRTDVTSRVIQIGVILAALPLLTMFAWAQKDSGGDVARGEYLVSIMGCDDCHTPFKMGPQGPERDMSRRLSGHPGAMELPAPPKLPPGPWLATMDATMTAFAGPWGITYSANLTSDETNGLGAWTEEMFVKAMRSGKHMGQSRPIMPPMPWESVAKLKDEDIKALFAYLRTVPPVDNLVPDYAPPAEGMEH